MLLEFRYETHGHIYRMGYVEQSDSRKIITEIVQVIFYKVRVPFKQ